MCKKAVSPLAGLTAFLHSGGDTVDFRSALFSLQLLAFFAI